MKPTRNSRYDWWIPYSGLILFIVGSAVLLGALLDGFSNVAPLFLPMLLLSIILTGIGWQYIRMKRLAEAQAIANVLADYWACWPQFNTVEEWHEFAKREYERGQHPSSSLATALITLLIGFGVITVVINGILGPEFWYLFGLGTALLVAVGYVMIVHRKGQQLNEVTFMQRMKSPPSQVYLGPRGLYDKDTGYTAFTGLQAARFISGSTTQEYSSDMPRTINPPNTAWPVSEWSKVQLVFTRDRRYSIQFTISVPPGAEDEARQIVERISSAKLKR